MRFRRHYPKRPSIGPTDSDRDWTAFGQPVSGWILDMGLHESLQSVTDRDLGTIVFPARDAVMAPAIAAAGTWEPLETAWLERHLRLGQTFLNVGANVGYHVLRASRLVGPRGKVVAVEPDPINFAFLLANIALHNLRNVIPIRCAAGSQAVTMRLYRNRDNSGDSRLCPFPEASGSVEVPVVRLDALLDGQRIDVALIDTQGWDHEVVAGMTGLLTDGLMPMIVEFVPSWLRERGIDPLKVVRDFNLLGYQVGVLEAGLPAGSSCEDAVMACDNANRYYGNLELLP